MIYNYIPLFKQHSSNSHTSTWTSHSYLNVSKPYKRLHKYDIFLCTNVFVSIPYHNDSTEQMHTIFAYKADELFWWIQILCMVRHKPTKLPSWYRVYWIEHFVNARNNGLLQLKENHLIMANRIWKRRWYKKRVNRKSHQVSLVVPVR